MLNYTVNRRSIPIVNDGIKKPGDDKGKKYLKRIIISGLFSILFLYIIIYTLPKTILSTSSLLEHSVTAALIIFLVVLLFRYFSTLFFAYLYLNKYTFKHAVNYHPFISIIIPVFNEEKMIKNSISSLLGLNYENYEIIIVNDGSTDKTKDETEKFVGLHKGKFNEIKISLINKPHGGKSTALNAGIRYSQAEIVVCMDGDSMLSPNSLKYAVRHFVDPRIGAVAGNVKVFNRGKFLTDLQALEYLEGLNLVRNAQSFFKLVNIIPGPIGIFRREVILNAGFYSNDTFAEDADLTLKILSKKWKVCYEPNSISYTEAPEKLQQLLRQRYRWTRGILQSIKKQKKILLNPLISFGNTIILWTMFYEALIWPIMNITANLFFITVALAFGYTSLIFFWWAALAFLDLVIAIYCIAAEKEEFRIVAYALIYRIFFILIIDVCKTFSTIEEFLGFKMTWKKLDRIGTAKI